MMSITQLRSKETNFKNKKQTEISNPKILISKKMNKEKQKILLKVNSINSSSIRWRIHECKWRRNGRPARWTISNIHLREFESCWFWSNCRDWCDSEWLTCRIFHYKLRIRRISRRSRCPESSRCRIRVWIVCTWQDRNPHGRWKVHCGKKFRGNWPAIHHRPMCKDRDVCPDCL